MNKETHTLLLLSICLLANTNTLNCTSKGFWQACGELFFGIPSHQSIRPNSDQTPLHITIDDFINALRHDLATLISKKEVDEFLAVVRKTLKSCSYRELQSI